MAGTKETKEVLSAVNALAGVILPILKDGVQISDVAALVAAIQTKPEVLQAFKAASENIAQVKDEVKDLNFFEIVDLAWFEVQAVKKIMESIK